MDVTEQLKIQSELWTQWSHQALEYTNQIPPPHLYAALAALFLTTIVLLLLRLFKRSKSNTILLTGLSGSGKTVIFHQLRDGYSRQRTITSVEPDEGNFVLHSETTEKHKINPVHLVDVPGNSRLQSKLHELLPTAAGIVYVVDASEFFFPKRNAVSEYLYDILTETSIVKQKTPVLILCNKTDKVTAHSKDFICKQMEKEIDKLWASKCAISQADIANDPTLGVAGEAFTFSQCHNQVTIADASGLNGEIYELEQFIREHIKS